MESPPAARPEASNSRRWMLLITAGVALWGLFHAVGAYSLNHNPWRGVVVVTAVVLFLGFWWAMLASAARRKARGPVRP